MSSLAEMHGTFASLCQTYRDDHIGVQVAALRPLASGNDSSTDRLAIHRWKIAGQDWNILVVCDGTCSDILT